MTLPMPIPCTSRLSLLVALGNGNRIIQCTDIEWDNIRICFGHYYWVSYLSASNGQSLSAIPSIFCTTYNIINNKFAYNSIWYINMYIQSACSQLYSNRGPNTNAIRLLSGQPSICFCRNIEIWCTKEGQKRRSGNNLFEIFKYD